MGRGVHAPDKKRWRLSTVAVLIVVVPALFALIVAVVTWAVGVVTITTKKDELPASVTAFKAMCDSPRVVYTRTPPYAGPTPHPVVIFQGERVAGTQVTMSGGDEQLSPAWTPAEPAQVQLIVCAQRRDFGRRVKNCHFDRPVADVPMYKGVYEVTLYEARTGRSVVETKIEGDVASCPTVKHFGGQEERKLYTSPSSAQYVSALRRYVID